MNPSPRQRWPLLAAGAESPGRGRGPAGPAVTPALWDAGAAGPGV